MAENTTLPPPAAPAYDRAMEARVAVLEQIAVSIDETLSEIRQDIREMRGDLREMRKEITDVRREMKGETRWLLSLGLAATAFLLAADGGLFALIAHGFHWF
jgi:uncharacterized coiled-coil protein SlyX